MKMELSALPRIHGTQIGRRLATADLETKGVAGDQRVRV